MKIGFVINDIRTEQAAYTTVRLAMVARNLGHDVWLFSVADFIYDPDGSVHATAVTPQHRTYESTRVLLQELPDEQALKLVDMVRPKLIQDGMYLVALDIVGDKLMEINVFSPGGVGIAEDLTGAKFSDYIIADLERKISSRSYYGPGLTNVQLATL